VENANEKSNTDAKSAARGKPLWENQQDYSIMAVVTTDFCD